MRQGLRLDSRIWRWTVALSLLLSAVIWAASARAHAVPDNLADLLEELLPVVVHISTFKADGPAGGSEEFGLGSGFVIDSSGHIVTLHRIIEDVDEIKVRLHDGTSLVAEVIGSDEKTDLAILKVANGKPLPAADWGDSSKTRIGDGVIAIGSPFGLSGTVTTGIVSALQRDIKAGPYDDFIQTDAAINHGNSGGPMFNLEGEVIGINAAIYSPGPSGGSIGIGFAISSNLARNIIEQLRDHGRVRRGWLGVRIRAVTDELAEELKLEQATGALVALVTADGPAEAAGIKEGDVILKFDGHDITEIRELSRKVAEAKIGKAVDVVVWRKNKEVTLQTGIREFVEEELATDAPGRTLVKTLVSRETELVEPLGLVLAQLTPEWRIRYELGEDAEGVIITDVEVDGTAAEKGLRPGDIIVEVDGERVRMPDEVAERVERAKDGFRVVTLLVFRQGDFQWVAVRLDNN